MTKPRKDGKGDAFAKEHRHNLSDSIYMNDFDAVLGTIMWGKNGAERLFIEYVPDNFKNKGKKIRDFGFVCLFDRKKTTNACKKSDISTAVYLSICRTLSKNQPVDCRFFFVIGKDEPPWYIKEVDIRTGEKMKDHHKIEGCDWSNLWSKIGLKDSHDKLKRWLNERDK